MPNRSENVYGYISKPLKERMDKIEQCDPDYTMSRIVRKGVERVVSELEHEFFGAPNREKPARKHHHLAGA